MTGEEKDYESLFTDPSLEISRKIPSQIKRKPTRWESFKDALLGEHCTMCTSPVRVFPRDRHDHNLKRHS